jgi:hypothetical protein
MLVGWFASWLAQGKWRKAARESKAELAQVQQELAELRKAEQQSGQSTSQDIIHLPRKFHVMRRAMDQLRPI